MRLYCSYKEYTCYISIVYLYDYRMRKRKQGKGKGGWPSVKVGKCLGQGSRVPSRTKYVLQNMKNFFDV